MEKEIYISNMVKDFLQELSKKYNTNGIWLAKYYFRRWDFLVGIKGDHLSSPKLLKITDNLGLFVENSSLIVKDIEQIKNKIIEMVYENRN